MSTLALLTAAALTFIIGLVHSLLGEWKLIGPLLAPETRRGMLDRSGFARNVLRFGWHITTLAWWGMGAVLAGFAFTPGELWGRVALVILSATFVATGIVILVIGRGRHLAWPVFLAIGALTLVPLA